MYQQYYMYFLCKVAVFAEKKIHNPLMQIRMSIGFFENVHDILFMYSCILFLTFQNAKIMITISVILF